jgi:hypothetical protein
VPDRGEGRLVVDPLPARLAAVFLWPRPWVFGILVLLAAGAGFAAATLESTGSAVATGLVAVWSGVLYRALTVGAVFAPQAIVVRNLFRTHRLRTAEVRAAVPVDASRGPLRAVALGLRTHAGKVIPIVATFVPSRRGRASLAELIADAVPSTSEADLGPYVDAGWGRA